MDKVRGDYASAYKLSRSTKDTKQRLHRRSLEQKELRRVEVDKRRNINDLSPVLEGDVSQKEPNKDYKEKTPTRRTGNKQAKTTGTSAKKEHDRVNDRMEMLKRWKAEREEKKKAELQAKKGNVFRVSKNVDRKERNLFKKSHQPTSQTKTNAVPVRTHSVPAKAPSTTVIPGHKLGTQTHSATEKPHVRSVQAHSKASVTGKAATQRSRSPKAVVDPNKGKVMKTSVRQTTGKVQEPSSHTTRQAKQPVTTARPTRGATRPKVTEAVPLQQKGKNKAGNVPKAENTHVQKKSNAEHFGIEPTSADERDVSINLTKVTLRDTAVEPMDSFAPSDCTFSAPVNVSSFVFKPLSPASAASFLYPNQDTCSSFLDTKPNRASTPKSGDKDKGESTFTNFTDQTSMNEKTVVPLETTETKSSNEESIQTAVDTVEKGMESEQKEASPVKTRRSTRRSLNQTTGSASENEQVSNPSPLKTGSLSLVADSSSDNEKNSKQTPVKTRGSLRLVADSSSENEQVSTQTPVKTPARSSRKTRRSVLPTVSETDTNSESDKESDKKIAVVTPSQSAKRPRRSLRKSVLEASESDKMESSEEEMGSPSKRRRTSRRSVASLESQNTESAEEQMSDSKQQKDADTPSRTLRRSSRRSNVSNLIEEKGTGDEIKELENKKAVESIKDFVPMVLNAGILETDKTQTVSNTTPARQKGRAGRKTFGGFAVPDSNSRVLSAKRSARKSMLPKSPEEWVELLNHSPMVEMTRRTPKSSATKSTKSPNGPIPTLSFDDIDIENIPPVSTAEPQVPCPSMSQAGEESRSNLTQPMETLTLGLNETARSPKTASDALPVVEVPTSKVAEEIVQVEEISSTQDGPMSDESESGEHNVKYFRNLLKSERARLNGLCSYWESTNDSTEDLTEEVRGQIRTTIGQAMLLMNQRFKQFSGLVDNCEFNTGEKETTCTDLQGFWDMIYFQVEDVNAKFDGLAKLEENNWVDDKPKPVAKKIVKKKAVKPAAPKLNVKSKFAAFRAQMKKQQQEPVSSPAVMKEEEKVFEVPGFFKVASPVRSPKPHCEAGTPKKAKAMDEAPSSLPSEQSGSGGLLNRTPARKSYAPVIPSPLLQDTTPVPRPARSCTRKTPIPKRLLGEADLLVEAEPKTDVEKVKEMEVESPRVKNTPRRSLRARKSVTFGENMESAVQESPASTITNSPVVEGSDADFERLLQPIAARQEADNDVPDDVNDSFSKYLQPTTRHNTSTERENSPKETGRRRRPSLKMTKSAEKRRSRGHSVHFVSPVIEHSPNLTLPHTPYNRDSLVEQKRVTRSSLPSSPKVDVFDIENIDNENDVPSPSRGLPSRRAPRPSLLYTPPKRQKTTASNRNVPTATLISFSP